MVVTMQTVLMRTAMPLSLVGPYEISFFFSPSFVFSILIWTMIVEIIGPFLCDCYDHSMNPK